MFRQGDIYFLPEEAPQDAKPHNSNVVAEGEVTGHAHRVVGKTSQVLTSNGVLFVNTGSSGAEVVHEDHGTITLPAGKDFRVIRQVENDPWEGIRQVMD